MRRFLPNTAPKVWKFKDPNTGREFQEETKKALFDRIITYRSFNNLFPIEALVHVIEDYNCSLPDNCSICEDTPLERGWIQYLEGGIALLKQTLFKKFAPQHVADARAEVCLHCPNNIFPDKEGFLAWSDQIAEQSVGDLKSIHHSNLGSCSACSCVLKAKVFYGGKISLSKEEHTKISETNLNCWQLNATGN